MTKVKYSDIQVGTRVMLGKFLCPENKEISQKTGIITSKCSGGSGGHIKVLVDEMKSRIYTDGAYTVHLNNIKSVSV
jgi:hypothetical protein